MSEKLDKGQQPVVEEGNSTRKEALGKLADQTSGTVEELRGMSDLQLFAAELGLTETPEMLKIRAELVALVESGGINPDLWNIYRELAKGIIDVEPEVTEGKELANLILKKQIAFALLKASIYSEAGNDDYFEEDMEEILMMATPSNFGDIRKRLKGLM